jgi:tRNA dimethylallyltransferase
MPGPTEMFAVIGPTASGKSRLALELARRVGGEILAVDSMTIYRGMDIGTAKPTPEERAGVRHHLMDVADPGESFAVARFVELADAVIADARRRGVPLVAVGGTPMYFKAVFEGLFDGPGADADLRRELEQTPPEQLYEKLKQVDPDAAGRFHMNDTRRLIRALEVYELTGRPISDHQKEWGGKPRHPATWIGLTWDKDLLNRRINARVRDMITSGWVDEVRTLLAGPPLSRTAAEATGYAELADVLNGRASIDDAVEQIKIRTRQLARRQIKWFRRFVGVTWFDGQIAADEIARQILSRR